MAIDPNQINQLKGKQLKPTTITSNNLDFNRNIQIQGPGNNVPEDNGMDLDYYSLLNLGLAGISTGLNFNQDLQNRQDLYNSIQNRDSKPLYDYNYMYGRTTSGGTEFQPVIKAEMGAEINKRYNTPQGVNNVEIEGGEFLQLPDMSTELAYGPSHNNGGVKTSLPNGTRVFSNHLKPMGSKKTFAQMAKKYDTIEYDKILDNKFAKQVDKDTAMIMKQKNQKILDKLFMDQQLLNGNSNGEPMAKNGASINNAGFKALPKEVQEQILSNMEYGGFSLPNPLYMQNGAWYDESTWDKAVEKAGKITGYGKANIPQENVTPTGKKNTFAARNQSLSDYLQSWEDVVPGISTNMTEGEAQKAIYEWSLKNNPDAIREMWQEFGLTNEGKKYKDLVALTTKGAFDPKTLQDTKVIEALQRAYVDNKFGVRQLQKPSPKKEEPPKEEPKVNNSTKEEPKKEDPKTPDFQSVEGKQSGKYYRQDFPLIQAVPQAIGLAESQELFPYAIPEIDSQYLRPQTLNIQSELQDIDNMGQAAIRAGADPLATYIAGMQGKQKAFQTKQNYDAEGRSRADMFNAQADQQTNTFNAQMFDRTYNNLIAQARDAQTAEQQAAIASLTTNYSKYNQDENLKSLYLDNLQTAFEIGKDRPFSMTLDKNGKPVFTFDSMQESTTDTKTTKSENITTPKLGSKSKSKTSNK
jgi:hypothetical protein